MAQVIIADDRKPWMKSEDRVAACMRCSQFKHCQTRCGLECKKHGGDVIPKVRRDRGDRS
jgi:hypothetical protein